jgi:predicted nucleic acid-binding protein
VAGLGRPFLDTSVLLPGLIELGPASRAAQQLYALVAARRLGRVRTAWHCCLEFYSVATRLPEEFRLSPRDAAELLEQEVLGRLEVLELPARRRRTFVAGLSRDQIRGGRLYDAHVAAVAREAGSSVVVTDNERHFASLAGSGIPVLSAAAALAAASRASR